MVIQGKTIPMLARCHVIIEQGDEESTAWDLARSLRSIADDAQFEGQTFTGHCPNDGDCPGGCDHPEPLEYMVLKDNMKNYRGVILVLSIGGPHIELNTRDGKVNGVWGNDVFYQQLDQEACDRIDETWEELTMDGF